MILLQRSQRRVPRVCATALAVIGIFLSGHEHARARAQTSGKAVEEIVHVRADDGITNAGAFFSPAKDVAKPIAMIWVHGSGINFYYPSYVKIGRELAARGFAFVAVNTRMHDLGTVAAGFHGEKRIRGGAYWGRYSDQARDIAAWIAFANERGFKQLVLAGHSAGTTAVEAYQAEKQDPRVAGLVLASGRFQPDTTPTDQEMLAQAARLVAEGRGEELLHYPNRPTPSFVSAATFLDLAQWLPKDFFGVQTREAPIARVRCPILAWFGTDEADVGTAADLELLKTSVKRLTAGPERVDTVMIENAGHMYEGHESAVADVLTKWLDTLIAR